MSLTCSNCGHPIGPTDRFCEHCGKANSRLDVNRQGPSTAAGEAGSKSGPARSSGSGMLIGAAAVIGVVLLAIGGYQAGRRGEDTSRPAPLPDPGRPAAAPPRPRSAPVQNAPVPASAPARPAFTGYVAPERLMPFAQRKGDIFELHQPMRARVFYPETFLFTAPSVSSTRLGSLVQGDLVEMRGWTRNAKDETWARICPGTHPAKLVSCAWIDYESLVAAP